jgi:hypothetical protein
LGVFGNCEGGGSNRHWDGITGTGTGTGYAQSSEAKRIVLGNFFDSAFNNHSHAERESVCEKEREREREREREKLQCCAAFFVFLLFCFFWPLVLAGRNMEGGVLTELGWAGLGEKSGHGMGWNGMGWDLE